jgi:hypothetical protein
VDGGADACENRSTEIAHRFLFCIFPGLLSGPGERFKSTFSIALGTIRERSSSSVRLWVKDAAALVSMAFFA